MDSNDIYGFKKVLNKYCGPLCRALNYGSVDSVRKALSDKKDNLNDDPCGYTPLHFAIRSGCSAEVIKLLVDAGADINLKNSDFNTPLHLAFEDGYNHDVAEILIAAGANLNSKDEEGLTPLHTGMRKCSVKIAKMMFDSGADMNSRTSDGKTPLHFAAADCNIPVIEYLISRGVDVNAKDYFGETSLHCLAQSGLFGKGEMYVHGFYLGTGDRYEKTFGDRAIALEILLKNGADADALNIKGETPFHVIAKSSNDRLAQLLLKHMAKSNPKNDQAEKQTIGQEEETKNLKSSQKEEESNDQSKDIEGDDKQKKLEKIIEDLYKENEDLKKKFISLESKVKNLV